MCSRRGQGEIDTNQNQHPIGEVAEFTKGNSVEKGELPKGYWITDWNVQLHPEIITRVPGWLENLHGAEETRKTKWARYSGRFAQTLLPNYFWNHQISESEEGPRHRFSLWDLLQIWWTEETNSPDVNWYLKIVSPTRYTQKREYLWLPSLRCRGKILIFFCHQWKVNPLYAHQNIRAY